jgi:YcaO-like protein with predicted kinase domain
LRNETAQQETRIDLDSVDDPDCREVLGKYERAGVCVAVWETTSDIGIPAFLCLLTERTVNPLQPLASARGFGCHPARSIALLRALTEAAQSRLTYISGSRDDLGRNTYDHSLNIDTLRSDRARMDIQGFMRDFSAVPTFDGATFDDDIAWELERLRSAGIDNVIVVDLTKPELGLAVVRVVIPGLEPKVGITDHIPGPRAVAIRKNSA